MLTKQFEIESNKKNTDLKELYCPNPLLQITLSEPGVSSNTFESLHFDLRWNDNKHQELLNPDDYNVLHSFLSKKPEIQNISAFCELETLFGQENPNCNLKGKYSYDLLLEVFFESGKSSIPGKSLYFKLTLLDNGCYTLKIFNCYSILYYIIDCMLKIYKDKEVKKEECDKITDGSLKDHTKEEYDQIIDGGFEDLMSNSIENIFKKLSKFSSSIYSCSIDTKFANSKDSSIINALDIEVKPIRKDLSDDDKKHGYGEYIYTDGSKYTGNFKDDKYNGYGESTFPNGSKYTGEYKDGKYSGYGESTFPNGSKYTGEYKDGKRHGFGEDTYADSSKYIGEYKDDQKHGYGEYIFKSGSKYTGEFKYRKQNGYGKYTHPDGSKYTGEYKDDKRHGYGKYNYSDGSKYIGEFKDDNQHGYGEYTRPNGSKYTGEWKDDKYNGYGKLTFKDGKIYTGEFKNHKSHGYGKYTQPDGKSRKAVFENNKFKMWLE